MTCPQLRTKTRTSISKKNGLREVGISNPCAVEQFSSLFSKDKLKQGAHIHQTYDPPSPRIRGRAAVRLPANSPHMCCVELALKGLASGGKVVAVRMCEVMARPWVGVCAPLLFDLLVIRDLPSLRMSWWNCFTVSRQQLPHVLCGAGVEEKLELLD